MSKLKEVAPPKDRVQVYQKNPFYIQYKNKPLFLYGCNQGWVTSLQNLDHDYLTEFDLLAKVGGNLVRITPFITESLGSPKCFDDRMYNLPWCREGGQYRLDLENGGANPMFWERLEQLVRDAYERDIIISFEFWDLYGPARGPETHLLYKTSPGDRWGAHPFFPGNSPDLTGSDMLPPDTYKKDIAFCRTVTHGGYEKALRFQEQYVRKMLDTLSPYPNVIYCMVNETSAKKEWSDYWLDFTRRYFDEIWDGAPFLAGEMPREFSFTENFTIEDMIDDTRYGFADASQYLRGNVKNNLIKFYEYCRKTDNIKPITCMKIYNRLSPDVNWTRLFGGAASSRYHRLKGAGWFDKDNIPEGAFKQLDFVKHLTDFIRDTDYQPWNMEPFHKVVIQSENIDETMAMCSKDRQICAGLIYCTGKRENRCIRLSLPKGEWNCFWLNPANGKRTEKESCVVDGDNGLERRVPEDYLTGVFYCKIKQL